MDVHGDDALMTGNGIPDHAVEDGSFATPVGVQNLSVSFSLAPAVSGGAPTTFARQPSGDALNSVKLDPATDGSCASTATSTAPGGGCVAIMGRDPWRLEAMGGAFKFGTDENNAHTQPNGQYHYRGMPERTVARAGMAVTLVGFAMDGFPIYARYGYSVATDASSALKVIVGSWQLKATPDADRPDTGTFPMGTFTSDYEQELVLVRAEHDERVEPAELSTADVGPGARHVLVLLKTRFPAPPRALRLETDLLGTAAGEGQLTIRATRGSEAEVAVLRATDAARGFFYTPRPTSLLAAVGAARLCLGAAVLAAVAVVLRAARRHRRATEPSGSTRGALSATG